VIAQFYYFIRERKNIESFVIISDKKMSLADELLADLEEMDGGQGASQDQNNLSKDESMETDQGSSTNSFPNKNSVHAVAKLKDSLLLQETMRKIDFYTKHQRKSTTEIQGPVEHDPEYLLIVDANNLLVEIDNEIDIIHNFVRTIYHKRFPELEQLVQLPMDYLQTVKVRFLFSKNLI
jgi:U4/U6 small nuclear ribonucleoprotein PRP31